MHPRFGTPPRPGQSYRFRAGVYAVLPRDGRVLLTRQTGPKGEIQLPGGAIDPGESPLAALYREVREETGWQIAHPVLWGRFRRFTFMPDYGVWAEKMNTIYIARPVRHLGPPLEPGHVALWLAQAQAARQLDNPGDRAAVASLTALGGRPLRRAARLSRYGRTR